MATDCQGCGRGLGFLERLGSQVYCGDCQQQRAANVERLSQLIRSAVADDYLDEREEQRINDEADRLGMTDEEKLEALAPYGTAFLVAKANAGRLGEVHSPTGMILKRGEVAYLQREAALMSEVAKRAYRGGYSGVSFEILPGVSYHIGGSRGESAVVGTELQEADYGILTITSERAVFTGSRRSVECQWSKLLGLNVYTDGIQFHVENRPTAPLFKVGSGDEVAAIVNAAIQRHIA